MVNLKVVTRYLGLAVLVDSWDSDRFGSSNGETKLSLLWLVYNNNNCVWSVWFSEGLGPRLLTSLYSNLEGTTNDSSESTPMGDELKWLLKEEGGLIFESCDVVHRPHMQFSLALFMWVCSDSAMPLCHVLAHAITANSVSLHLLVPPLGQCCFFSASCWGINRWRDIGWGLLESKQTTHAFLIR